MVFVRRNPKETLNSLSDNSPVDDLSLSIPTLNTLHRSLTSLRVLSFSQGRHAVVVLVQSDDGRARRSSELSGTEQPGLVDRVRGQSGGGAGAGGGTCGRRGADATYDRRSSDE
jgi:hypothetical protein